MKAYETLPPKQRHFVDEYHRGKGGDAAAAVVRAGYKTKRPEAAAAKLMANPAVQAAIAERARAKLLAGSSLRPTVQGGLSLAAFTEDLVGKDNGSLVELINALSEQTKLVTDGSLARGEAMLAVQAHTLDALFNRLARTAMKCELMDHFETYLKLALRAQSQCRAAWEAVSAIQNPPIAGYVKQANIAQGHQQVNNGPPPARVRENPNPQTKQLEDHSDDEPCNWMDTRAPETAGRTDSAVEAVGEVNRPSDSPG